MKQVNAPVTADHQLAEKLCRDRLDLLELRYGADRIETATELNRLAQILQACGKKAEAEKIRKRVTNIMQKRYGR
jgi:hypothetical protein